MALGEDEKDQLLESPDQVRARVILALDMEWDVGSNDIDLRSVAEVLLGKSLTQDDQVSADEEALVIYSDGSVITYSREDVEQKIGFRYEINKGALQVTLGRRIVSFGVLERAFPEVDFKQQAEYWGKDLVSVAANVKRSVLNVVQ